MLRRKLTLASVGALLALSACGSDENPGSTAEEGVLVECYAIWFGALPDYEGQSVTIRACLNDAICSDEHLLTTERGSGHDYYDFQLSAAFYPSGTGNHIGNEEINLHVALWYSPRFAEVLGDEDRATLLVKADDGSIVMDSVSAVPYLDDLRRDGSVHCKSVYLRLDGSERPLPVSDPDEPLPPR